jgi:hypothetical protein
MRPALAKRTIGMALTLVLATVQGGAAQSLFNAVGIGTPMDAIDARAVALGGMGIGLMGGDLLPTDPAAAADLGLPTMIMTARPSWVNFDRSSPSESGSFQSTLFPLMGLAYPIPRVGVLSLTLGSVLDQRFEAKRTEQVALYDTTTTVQDVYVSQGGVSSVRLGLARNLGNRLSVGLTVGRYTGSTTKRLERTFPLDSLVSTYQAGGFWSYSGSLVSGGASVRFGGIARVAGSVTLGSTLHAKASSDTQGGDATYDLPLQYRIGASALLARGVTLTGGVARANWAAVKGGTFNDGSAASTTTSFGFGLELTQATLFGRTSPIRLGYRHSQLPFAPGGAGTPIETALSAGLGVSFHKTGDYTLAGVDLSLERGTRRDPTLTEHFWRGTLTLRVTGL